jgi:hypothetical protein
MMKERLCGAALVLAALFLVAGCGGSSGSSGPPETMAAAREAIEKLPYPIDLREPAGVHGVLVAHLHGKRGETSRFFVFVDRPPPTHLPGVPDFHGYSESLLGGSVTDHYAIASNEIRKHGESHAQYRERSHVELEVEEALCKQATGEACGI